MPETTEIVDFLVDAPLKIVVILVLAVVANRVARKGVKRALRTLQSGAVQERLGSLRAATPDALLATTEHSLRAEQRIEALASVLRSLTTFVIYAVAAFMILGEVGIELGPLIAGAGIIGVALGFGSQSLVKDFLSGVFILIEDQFGVGDIVNLDNETSGTVEAVSLRTTRLRAVDGTVWHVPNGEIRRVGNQSQHWSRALIDVEVAYETDLDHAQSVIAGVGPRRARRARGLGRRGARRQRRHDPARRQDPPVTAVPRVPRSPRALEGGVRARGHRDPVPAADRLASHCHRLGGVEL
jgi:small-conductance mechanosensitive channel